ncbi:hypothetical protein MHM84_03335 [Halomonas sp. McH1-25]|uniref:hypothetical protein n=1 Tax=unclassified Halomonas TaxID=2609666 RepID=UPI001EF4F487|nr:MULTISPECIES: hypothetical protein [unclassified Halomonas]MCG7598808.1 hypothetical protein [Halomonas sp. McH1-25]MCP1340771.1 hypothetical protein [Halomonas sp. FL8]MCP1362194.1 hypothetical protein [Halomonas sp. BBD45]MCP1365770.1 hypothetical protein [Halomonas sp. BBD48]
MRIDDQLEACIHDYYQKHEAYPDYITVGPNQARELKKWAAMQSGIDEISPTTFKGVEIKLDQSQVEPMIPHGANRH